MKRVIVLLAAIFIATLGTAPCSADVSVQANGGKPTITEFFRAYAGWRAGQPADDESKGLTNDAYNYIWLNKPAHSSDKKTVDAGSGYLSYTGGGKSGPAMECCFWNTADRKNIIFAANFTSGNADSAHTFRIDFFLYDNAAKTMKKIDPPFGVRYESQQWNDRFASTEMRSVAFRLPRSGKNIKVETTGHNEQGKRTNRTEMLKWNGHGFN